MLSDLANVVSVTHNFVLCFV